MLPKTVSYDDLSDDFIKDMILEAMRMEGFTTYIDTDGVEKPL